MTSDVKVALRQQLKRDEGTGIQKNGHFLPYYCTSGKLTIGWGHNLQDNGIKPLIAEMLLDSDIEDAEKELIVKLPWAEALDAPRLGVLVNMAFNMGVPKLVGFEKMLFAVRAKDYEMAAVEMLDSLWADQVGDRALRLAEQMRRGSWI
jgi:lysozyme